jgi:hypothetical protein
MEGDSALRQWGLHLASRGGKQGLLDPCGFSGALTAAILPIVRNLPALCAAERWEESKATLTRANRYDLFRSKIFLKTTLHNKKSGEKALSFDFHLTIL